MSCFLNGVEEIVLFKNINLLAFVQNLIFFKVNLNKLSIHCTAQNSTKHLNFDTPQKFCDSPSEIHFFQGSIWVVLAQRVKLREPSAFLVFFFGTPYHNPPEGRKTTIPAGVMMAGWHIFLLLLLALLFCVMLRACRTWKDIN